MALTLIGYRGSGKSCVGPVLAARMGWEFVDADLDIEQRTGMSIAAIFSAEGEAGFRRREESVMDDLLRRNRCVIAAGGGAILSEATRKSLPDSGPVVYLRVRPETADRRTRQDAQTTSRRPALTELPPGEEIERLMAVREPLYLECATIMVDADDLDVETIAETILSALPAEIRPVEDA